MKIRNLNKFIKIGSDAFRANKLNLLYNIPLGVNSWMSTTPIKDTQSVSLSLALGVAQYLYDERLSVKGVSFAEDIRETVSNLNNKIKSVATVGVLLANLRGGDSYLPNNKPKTFIKR